MQNVLLYDLIIAVTNDNHLPMGCISQREKQIYELCNSTALKDEVTIRHIPMMQCLWCCHHGRSAAEVQYILKVLTQDFTVLPFTNH